MGPLGDRGSFLGGADVWATGPDGSRVVATLRSEASQHGRPGVVLLHGLSQQRRFWGPVAGRLADEDLLVVDLRGHGDSDKPDDGPYDVPTCAADVSALLDEVGWSHAVVVGHSWGAAVALAVAAYDPGRVASVVAIDGGASGPADLGDRDQVRARLTPPRLGVPQADLVAMLRSGALGPWWDADVEAALLPTFETSPDGLVRTRLGFDRHMRVLDGLLDHDPEPVLASIGCPAWVVFCDPLPDRRTPAIGADDPTGKPRAPDSHDVLDEAWHRAKDTGYQRAAALLARPRLLRWAGALHDVPLQWPALVAGLIRSAADEGAGS
jgi:pimeloyl-ACP methyl ester carboxylesterase